MSIESFSIDEHEMVLRAKGRYGEFFSNALDVTLLLSNIMMWPTTDCDIFIRFLSQMKTYHTLSLMSLVRQHRIQAKMDLRYFLESSVHAAYSLVHVETTNYFDSADGKRYDYKKATKVANLWLNEHFQQHSNEIKRVKDQINEQTAHANALNSFHNFRFVGGNAPEIHTSFFDFEDDHWLKVDLWECAQSGLVAIDLILNVRQKFGGFIQTRATDALPLLIASNKTLSERLEAEKQ
jgi:hypothetical protein